MKTSSKKQVEACVEKVRAIHAQLNAVYEQESSAFHGRPESVRESEWGLEEEERIDSLESAVSYLSDSIDNLEDVLGIVGVSTEAVDIADVPDLSEEPVMPEEPRPRLGFFSKLMMGLAGAHAIESAERALEADEQEREQRRHDSLFWQDAARRDDPAYSEYGDEDNDDY